MAASTAGTSGMSAGVRLKLVTSPAAAHATAWPSAPTGTPDQRRQAGGGGVAMGEEGDVAMAMGVTDEQQ